MNARARARGASISEQGRMRRKYKRSMSASAGMPALVEQNLKTVLTKDRVPHMDNYRHSIDHRKPKFIYFISYDKNVFFKFHLKTRLI